MARRDEDETVELTALDPDEDEELEEEIEKSFDEIIEAEEIETTDILRERELDEVLEDAFDYDGVDELDYPLWEDDDDADTKRGG